MLNALVHDATLAHTGTIIWLHGLGASGHDFAPVPRIANRPHLRWVFPHAPERPVTINGGYVMPAWYDILSMTPGPKRESESDIRTMAVAVNELIDAEIARGVPSSRVVLAGFSQGGAMAYHCGLRRPESLAGIVALSTYLALEDTLAAELTPAAASTPLFAAHGTRDAVVPAARGERAYQLLKAGRDATWRTYPMAHELSAAELRDLLDWLAVVLP